MVLFNLAAFLSTSSSVNNYWDWQKSAVSGSICAWPKFIYGIASVVLGHAQYVRLFTAADGTPPPVFVIPAAPVGPRPLPPPGGTAAQHAAARAEADSLYIAFW